MYRYTYRCVRVYHEPYCRQRRVQMLLMLILRNRVKYDDVKDRN